MCNEAVRREPYTLRYVLDSLKTQEMCDDAVWGDPYPFQFVPDCFKTQKMCNMAMLENPAVFFLFLIALKHKKCVSRHLK